MSTVLGLQLGRDNDRTMIRAEQMSTVLGLQLARTRTMIREDEVGLGQ